MQQLSWREKYAGILVLLIGIIYLIMQLASLMSNTSHPYALQNGSLVISRNELLSDVKAYSLILAGIIAGWCLLKGKRLGWMLVFPCISASFPTAAELGTSAHRLIVRSR